MPIIFHVTTNTNWKEAKANGFYIHPSLKDEGFIHCSQVHQVAGVLERYFAGQTDLVKLVIDTDKLTSKHAFPHVYGPINSDAVIDVIAL